MSMIIQCNCSGCQYPFWVSAYDKRPVLYCPFCGVDQGRMEAEERRQAEQKRLEEFKKSPLHQWALKKTGKLQCGG